MKARPFIVALTAVLLLAACAPATVPAPTANLDTIRTSAANTVVAEFTLTAAAFSPTPRLPSQTSTPRGPTSTATNTPIVTDLTMIALGTPGALCDDYNFDLDTLDVTIPDGSQMTAGQEFVKTWKIKNTGACTWGEGYSLIHSYGERMDGQPVPLNAVVLPGEEVDVSVNFKAPSRVGEYSSYWQMVNPQGIPFGGREDILIAKIVVR
jgi:hypothetical protein